MQNVHTQMLAYKHVMRKNLNLQKYIIDEPK